MRVLVLETIKTKRGTLAPGLVVDIPGPLAERLRGRVEPVDTPLPSSVIPPLAEDLFDMIRQTIDDLDQRGRPWTGWRDSLSPGQWRHIKGIEERIDSAYGEQDRQGLKAALRDYLDACLRPHNNQERIICDA